MFERLGRGIARRPGLFILAWVALVAAGAIWTMIGPQAPPPEVGSFLPEDDPLNKAVRLSAEAFPELASHSQIVVIAHRGNGLEGRDFEWLDDLARSAAKVTDKGVLSPATSYLRHRLVSPDGQAAMVVCNLASNFISASTAATVEQVEHLIVARPPPEGLATEITGTAGIGRDYGVATREALDNTTWVTIVAVLAILIMVYRSPVGALVPLVSIGACVYIAFVLLDLLAHVGWQIAAMERIFAIVLIFGMGVDFALFWIARYREILREESLSLDAAAVAAMRQTGPAIVASAATTICGLTTMLATDLVPTRTAGQVLAVVLTVTMIAALTLSPALARRLGRALFWPTGFEGRLTMGQRILWPAIARFVTTRPLAILVGGTLMLGTLAALATQIPWRFDSLSELPKGSSSQRGFQTATEHFAPGQLYSNTVLLNFEQPPGSVAELQRVSRSLVDQLIRIEGVHDVYSLDSPLGRKQGGASGAVAAALTWLAQDPGGSAATKPSGLSALLGRGLSQEVQDIAQMARFFYLAQRGDVLRFEILIDYRPFSPEAMALMQRVGAIAKDDASRAVAAGPAPDVLMTGPTPYVVAVREVAGRDQVKVMILATAVIALIVLALVRDLPLTLFMLLATWLTYGATLMLSQWFFVNVLHQPGLDWKVRLIVFVIIVAVGQDYNIFLVSRLFQEPADVSNEEAARRAIVRTGSVISSCGLIMAATLGSLWAGGLGLLRQVGFALALGILIDTFFVRPLLLPSFFLAARRRRSGTTKSALAAPASPE